MRIKTIIIDDELLAREYLKDYISKIPFLEFVGEFNSPLKAMELLKSEMIDLIFLDIQMPTISGIDFLRSIDNPPHIIITSAYKEFAIDGFELNVCDYLLKPFSFDRFLKAVNKIGNQEKKYTKDLYTSEIMQSTFHDNHLIIRADRRYYKINFDDLIYIEGQGAYVKFLMQNRSVTALASLRDLETQLPNNQFIRIHKSYIVSAKKIDTFDGCEIEIAGVKIPVSKSYKETVEKIFRI